jgi:signal transduction histidine kinase
MKTDLAAIERLPSVHRIENCTKEEMTSLAMEMTHAVSHELRTPLAVMRTEVDVILDDPESDLEEYQRMARVVRDASERANGLVEALLVLARSEAQSGRRLVRKIESDLADGATAALSALTLFSRPTWSGTIISGKMTVSRSATSGSSSIVCALIMPRSATIQTSST